MRRRIEYEDEDERRIEDDEERMRIKYEDEN